MKSIFPLLFICLFVQADEPSVFGAGDLNAESPYGLTEKEKLILKNKNKVTELIRDKNSLKSKTDELLENLDGLSTLIQSVSKQNKKSKIVIKEILITLDNVEVDVSKQGKRLDAHENNISSLREQLATLVETQTKNYDLIQSSFKTMQSAIDQLTQNSVSKQSFTALEKELVDFRALVLAQFKKLNKNSNTSTAKTVKRSNLAIYNEGKKLLKQKKYTAAIENFITTKNANYKPATSTFYLGEANYRLGNYKQAAALYKESYKRYKKGSYNNKLFLHMAISLHKIGQQKSARKFFMLVQKKYPKTAYARKATQYLNQ